MKLSLPKWLFAISLSAAIVFDLPKLFLSYLPTITKYYIDIKDKHPSKNLDISQLEFLPNEPRSCLQNADCIIKTCVDDAACRLVTVNDEYVSLFPDEFIQEFDCQPVDRPSDLYCQVIPSDNVYAACEYGRCIMKAISF